jgi:hypothetical protein
VVQPSASGISERVNAICSQKTTPTSSHNIFDVVFSKSRDLSTEISKKQRKLFPRKLFQIAIKHFALFLSF